MGNCLTTALTTISGDIRGLAKRQVRINGKRISTIKCRQMSRQAVKAVEYPLHASLPDGAEKYHVRNVYDGDTLTLTDESRVRFLGIDTPEIKQKQPFAEEAKEYTKSRCDKKDVWLSFEGDKTDHYGRILAFVYVEQDGGYLCMNEGIVAAGLASVYAPNVQSKTKNYDKMIALQTKARAEGKGMWSKFQNRTVVKTANGAAYHIRSCEHLANIRNLQE